MIFQQDEGETNANGKNAWHRKTRPKEGTLADGLLES
jgi:hypothetical protein